MAIFAARIRLLAKSSWFVSPDPKGTNNATFVVLVGSTRGPSLSPEFWDAEQAISVKIKKQFISKLNAFDTKFNLIIYLSCSKSLVTVLRPVSKGML